MAIVGIIAIAAMAIGIGYAYTAQTEITDNDVESTYILISAEASATPAASDYQSKFDQNVQYDTRVFFDAQNEDQDKSTNYKVKFDLLNTTQIKIAEASGSDPEEYIQATALGAAVLQVTDQNGLAPRIYDDDGTAASGWFFMNISVPVESLDASLEYYVKITAGNEERAKDLIPTTDDLKLTQFERHGDYLWASVPVEIVDANVDNKYTVCIAVTAPEGTQVEKFYKELPTSPELILDDATFAFSVASESLVATTGEAVSETRMVGIDIVPVEGLELDGNVIPVIDEKNAPNTQIASAIGFAWEYTPETTPTSKTQQVPVPTESTLVYSAVDYGATTLNGIAIDAGTGAIKLSDALDFGRHAYTITATQTDAQGRTIVSSIDIILNPVHTLTITDSEKFVIECDAGLVQTVGDSGNSTVADDQKISDVIVSPGAQYRFKTDAAAAAETIDAALNDTGLNDTGLTASAGTGDNAGKVVISGSLAKDFDLTTTLEGVMEKVYYVTLTPGFGYSYTDTDGGAISGKIVVAPGAGDAYSFSFKIVIDPAYDDTGMSVSDGQDVLTPISDVYTVDSMDSDVVIKVTGVVPASS